MRVLTTGEEFDDAKEWLEWAASTQAAKATCLKSKCGAVIVYKNELILGCGFNSPPDGLEGARRCLIRDLPLGFKSDTSCCVHAEVRAVNDALIRGRVAALRQNARLYFSRVDAEGKAKISGKPRCTICSKAVLDAGIKEFVLWHKEGITVYDTLEYNTISFRYNGEPR